jgi:N-acetylglucosaminyl-diphospho-decaprenol L-rhamnosyltransferase
VVVDYHSGEALVRCVESLREAGAGRVVVVDNAVPPGRARRALGAAHDVEVIETGRNLGYGSGANRGAGVSTADLLVICNPDVVVDREALAKLKIAVECDRDLAIVGPLVLEPGGTRYPSARRFPSLVEGAGHALAGLLAPGNRFSRRYRMDDLNTGRTMNVDWVSGSFMLVRRQVFEELGGFDETYFMYGEDVDLCWRAHRAGWGVAYVPSASVTHQGGVTTKRVPYRMLVAHHRSALRFAGRSLSGPRRLALPAIAAALGIRLVAEVAREAATSVVRRPGGSFVRVPAGGSTGDGLSDG